MNTPSPDGSWTVGRLLEWTTGYLKANGSESPRLDAEVLLAHARDCERIELYTAFQEVADEALRDEFRELVRRRSEGTPVAYLVGHREFYSLAFQVSPAVLIPRPETEFLLITLFDLVKQAGCDDRPIDIADVGTGSGNLACCVAHHLPTARVCATDISAEALTLAQSNATVHNVADRIGFLQGEVLEAAPSDQKFDFVISNPPYIGTDESGTVSQEVIDHEPHVALFAGPTGLDVIQPLVLQSAARLRQDGWLIFEISPMIADRTMELMDSNASYHAIRLIHDLAKQPRVVAAQRKRA